jgi:hypothetical protein
MQTRRFAIAVSAAAALAAAACSGGGGGSSGGGGNGGFVPTPTPPPATTNASGTLVSDPAGTAISGVHVSLQPWAIYPTPGPSPTPLAITATTDSNGNFTLANVPNGQYLLIIGSDDPNDTTNPTIHDHIMLTGGAQALVAPTLPAVSTLVTYNSVETGGKYRFRSLTNSCFAEMVAARTATPKLVADEWLLESAYWIAQSHNAVGYPGSPTANNNGSFGTNYGVTLPSTGCAQLISDNSGAVGYVPAAWYGGYYESTGAAFAGSITAGDMRVVSPNPGNASWP